MSDILKRKRLFYTPDDDLRILKEVVGQNPFEEPKRWVEIQKNVGEVCGKDFSIRSLKERIQLLAKRHSEKCDQAVFISGKEEEVTEMDDLLCSLLQIMNELKKRKHPESSHQKGLQCREKSLLDFSGEILLEDNSVMPDERDPKILDSKITIETENQENITGNANKILLSEDKENPNVGGKGRSSTRRGLIMTPVKTRNSGGLKQSSIRYLEKKNERWFEIRSKELAIEDKKLEIEGNEKKKRMEIEEKRIELEQKRVELEEKRFHAELEIFKNQQRLIELAFNALNK